MRITLFPPFITYLFAALFIITGCDTLPTGERHVPAPVEQHGVNSISKPSLKNTAVAAKVAVLLPLSGQNSELGQTMLQAAQLAVFDIGNSQFELIPFDTKGTFDGGVKAAENAIEQDVDIILGPIFADAVRGAKQIATPNDVKIIAFSTDWSLGNTATFMMGFMPFSQVDKIADYASEKGLKRFAIIAPNDKYGDVVSQRFEERIRNNNGSIVKTIRYTPNNMVDTNELTSLNTESLDAIFIPAGGKDLENISMALTTQGMPPSKIRRLGTGLWDNPEMSKMTALNGGWFAAPSYKTRQSFEQKYQSTYGQRPMRIATLTYDATALAAILSTKEYSFKAITDPNGFEGVDGVFKFGSNGVIQRNLAVHEIRNGQVIEISPAALSF